MKTLSDFNFKGQRVIVRVDFNVPLDNDYNITDDSRIVAAVPTIKKIINDGGKAILMSHLGRPKTGPEEKFSLKHLINHTSKLMGTDVLFANDCIGEEAMKFSKEMNEGEVLLLENLRFYKEETKGDEAFANKLADLADFYVNDAFGTAHRAHASTAIIAKFFPENKSFGYLMESEIENIEKVLHHAEKPYTAIIGGAKVSDKVLIIENLLEKVDNLLIGGGMAYTFIRAQGGTTGNSLVEEDRIELAKELIVKAEEKGVKLYLPFDSKIADNFDNDAKIDIVESSNIPEGWMGLDIGESAVNQYREVIMDSKTILWNGPMGVFEFENFQNGSKEVAVAVANATQQGAYSLIGGGDSVAAIKKFELQEKVSYISTGGGAMLEFLEGKELPGIKAIKE
jgi:phosphoglycerate kinase